MLGKAPHPWPCARAMARIASLRVGCALACLLLVALASAANASASGLLETATGAATQATAPTTKAVEEASAPVANAASPAEHTASEATAAVTRPVQVAPSASRALAPVYGSCSPGMVPNR